MELWIKIELDNAAFEDGVSYEVNRILAKAMPILPDVAGAEIPLRDINGNEVGFAGIYELPQMLTSNNIASHTIWDDPQYDIFKQTLGKSSSYAASAWKTLLDESRKNGALAAKEYKSRFNL